jgi:hypothetical protein
MVDADFEATVRAAFLAFNERRFSDFAASVTDDVVEAYPQSGEVMVGRANQQAMHEAFPHPPTFTIRSIHRSGDLAVVETDEGYAAAETWKTIFILELREGVIGRMTMYFGEPFSAPEWRRPFWGPPDR